MEHFSTLKKFFSDTLDNIERETKLKAVQGFSEELESFKQRLNDDFFRLAVIGEFSSGKSTFINALIGRDVLSHAAKETTAVLTKIINVAENDARKGSAVVFMKSGEKLTVKNFSALKDYTTAVSKKFHVAQEINAVEIYMPLLHISRPLMIMDTPGLNGMAQGHLEQTRETVKKAHACIYLIQQRGLTKDDLEFLRENLLPYQQRFIFVQNFIDEFNSLEGETLDDRIFFLHKTLSEKVFDAASGHVFFICGVSALKELAARDSAIKRLYATDIKDLTDDDRRRLAETSNFESFRKILAENFSEETLDDIRYRDTATAILLWSKGLLKKISRRLDEDVEIFKTSREKNAVERIERLIQRLHDRRPHNLMAIRGFISGEIRTLNKELEKIIADDADKIEQRLIREINDYSTPEELDSKADGLTKKISVAWNNLVGNAVDYCKISFQNMYQPVMERVEEYSGIRSVTTEEFKPDVSPVHQPKFQNAREDSRYAQELRRKQSELSGERASLQRTNSIIRAEERNVQQLNYEVTDARRRIDDKQRELNRMGSRPAERIWYETVADERGGFFGSILDFFSPKTKQEERRDDSARRQWDAEHRRLEAQQNLLIQQRNEVEKRKAAAQRTLDRYRDSGRYSEDRIRALEKQIRDLEERIRLDEARDKKQRELARAQYLRMRKNQLCESLTKYFHGEDGATRQLVEELNKQTTQGGQKLFAQAERRFNESVDKKLQDLEQARQGNISVLQKKIEGLEQSKINLERYVERMEKKLS